MMPSFAHPWALPLLLLLPPLAWWMWRRPRAAWLFSDLRLLPDVGRRPRRVRFWSAILRTTGLTLLMLTLAFTALLGEAANQATSITGGNDGLNTVVPFGLDGYAKGRRALRLPKGSLHKLNDQIGLHPGMGGLAKLVEGRLLLGGQRRRRLRQFAFGHGFQKGGGPRAGLLLGAGGHHGIQDLAPAT